MRLAVFVSPHGFGHAARTAAILEALASRVDHFAIELFTLVPEWFFRASLGITAELTYHELETDVGFVQRTWLDEDLPATVRRLDALYPVRDEQLSAIARTLEARRVEAVLCDISAVGLVAARACSLPCILVENFTWDLIYDPYLKFEPGLAPFIDYLRPLYDTANLRIQTEPLCRSVSGATVVGPVARVARSTPAETRRQLGLPADAPVVMISMGGVPGSFPFFERLAEHSSIHFVVAGFTPPGNLPANVRAVPHRSSLYHPDLVAAADAIVGKVGYSTVAEAYHGRTQFFFVPRPSFAESAVMEAFVTRELNGVEVSLSAFESGEWLDGLEERLAPVRSRAAMPNGAEAAAEALIDFLR